MNFCNNWYKTGKFAITDTKHFVPVVTLSTKENTKLLQQSKSGFKRKIKWNKNISTKPIFESLNWSKFSRNDRLFVLPFENKDDRRSHFGYYFPKVEIKDYNDRR